MEGFGVFFFGKFKFYEEGLFNEEEVYFYVVDELDFIVEEYFLVFYCDVLECFEFSNFYNLLFWLIFLFIGIGDN